MYNMLRSRLLLSVKDGSIQSYGTNGYMGRALARQELQTEQTALPGQVRST